MFAYVVLSLAGAVAPAAFMLHFVYVRDRYEREPLRLVLRVYALSFLSVIPAGIVELVGMVVIARAGHGARPVLAAFALAFLLVGPAEEGVKFLFLRRLAFGRGEFNEVYDGILYAVAVGLGFATLENVLYVFAAPDVSSRVALIILRGLLAVPAHALFGVIMGYCVGRAKFTHDPSRRARLLRVGFFVPAALHGLYDFPLLLLQTGKLEGATASLALVPFAVVIGLWVTGVRLIHRAQEESPFKRPNPLVNPWLAANMGYKFCTNCGTRALRTDRFCHVCGASWEADASLTDPSVAGERT